MDQPLYNHALAAKKMVVQVPATGSSLENTVNNHVESMRSCGTNTQGQTPFRNKHPPYPFTGQVVAQYSIVFRCSIVLSGPRRFGDLVTG